MKAANKITNWTYDKPTEAGDYLVCLGDVETPNNVIFVRFDKELAARVNSIPLKPEDFSDSYKFARLIYEPTELKAMECEE